MTSNEFRRLMHGDKIYNSKGLNFIVHNNHRSGSGMVVALRTEVIFGQDRSLWNISKKKDPTSVDAKLARIADECPIVNRDDC